MLNLLQLRKQNDLSQEQVAQIIGVSKQAYGHYEREERELGYDMLCKLADYYDVSVDYLIGHDSSPLVERPMSAIAENFIREYGELFSDETFQSYAQLYKLMDARQRIFVLGMIVGWLKEQGITIKNF